MPGDNPLSFGWLLAERRRNLHRLRARGRELAGRQTAAERELAALDSDRAGCLPGLTAFDWGELPALTPDAADRVACQRVQLARFLAPQLAALPEPQLEILPDPASPPLAGSAATMMAIDELAKLPANRYAVLLLPHILNLLPDPRPLLFDCRRVLRHGGLLLATLPGPAAPAGDEGGRDRHRYTVAAVTRLLGDYFPVRGLEISAAGGMADAVAAWFGLAEQPWTGGPATGLPLLIFARARKA